jgi:hypothetical protein
MPSAHRALGAGPDMAFVSDNSVFAFGFLLWSCLKLLDLPQVAGNRSRA